MSRLIKVLLLMVVLFIGMPVVAGEFETFDGRSYNGRYYPRIDIIEWGEPSHMEFHVYWKGHPLDMSFELEERDGKKVMLVHYYIKERNEHLCRRVLTPGHFSKSFLVYKDTSDKDMDATIVTMVPLADKAGLREITPTKYASCTTESPGERMPASEKAGEPDDQKRTRPDKGALRKPGTNVPFEDW